MSNIYGWKVVDLEYVPFDEAEKCDCGKLLQRWKDRIGGRWCEKCIKHMDMPWREVVSTSEAAG
jgi:hypothetical protein